MTASVFHETDLFNSDRCMFQVLEAADNLAMEEHHNAAGALQAVQYTGNGIIM